MIICIQTIALSLSWHKALVIFIPGLPPPSDTSRQTVGAVLSVCGIIVSSSFTLYGKCHIKWKGRERWTRRGEKELMTVPQGANITSVWLPHSTEPTGEGRRTNLCVCACT